MTNPSIQTQTQLTQHQSTPSQKQISAAEKAAYEICISYYVGKKVSDKVGKFFYKKVTNKLLRIYGE